MADYKKTSEQEVAELKHLMGDLHNITNVDDNIRALEVDDLIQDALQHTHKLVTVDGKVLNNYFFEHGVDHYDLYDVNHHELTKDRIKAMLTDTIDAIEDKVPAK
ncbi:hypothetical protein [Acetilactobacillus jinshanensis]|uniref:Uncharacterized protein n=1 Tax=Acetilactobacillus jinshanensis TaxID=1720083 RepID=A0A4P6ZKI5_9LACO|nr:hypothetical protein [Acetilactobacillus jinshanensis]QBP18194.1 hypothetical protein ELX58_03370 [Acetilactobacillus jinshanensis]URL61062.1 hypothetical protein HGK75_03435 [uncultured bacterium]